MKVTLSWLREFAETPADPQAVASKLASAGFEVASIEGEVMDFEITANRPDCLSVYGLAREASAAYDCDLKPIGEGADSAGHAPMPVSVGDAGCGRYALAIADVKVGPSPSWLADRLLAAGVRPINRIVDVTNYVMIETGQPMHAFDVVKLEGPEIRVRRARAGESLKTLDGQSRTLDETMLVIADRERPVAIAGVMGGAASEVSATSTKVAIESAWFLPSSVRATSRRLGLKTEASARFERGADITAPVRALRRAIEMLTAIGAGTVVGEISDVYPRPFRPVTVNVARARITRLLGTVVPDPDVYRILNRLGFGLTETSGGWRVEVPAFRVDVAREADVIEEIGRHWGFDRVPATFPALKTMPRVMSPAVARDRALRRVLCGAGLQEACTFTFIERESAAPFVAPGADLVAIANPLSEKLAVLRPSILPGLLDALVYNRRRGAEGVRLFESGAVFTPAGEAARVGWLVSGPRSDHWSGGGATKGVDVDAFDAIGVADLIGRAFDTPVSARATSAYPWFVPGRSAELVAGDGAERIVVGAAGEIRPDLVAARGLSHTSAVVAGELDHAALAERRQAARDKVRALPRFPSVVRDLSIIVSDRLPAADLRDTIRSNAPDTLVSVREFDRYQGKGVPPGSTSLALRLTFRHSDRTLTDAEVQHALERIIAAIAAAHGAVLRGKTE